MKAGNVLLKAASKNKRNKILMAYRQGSSIQHHYNQDFNKSSDKSSKAKAKVKVKVKDKAIKFKDIGKLAYNRDDRSTSAPAAINREFVGVGLSVEEYLRGPREAAAAAYRERGRLLGRAEAAFLRGGPMGRAAAAALAGEARVCGERGRELDAEAARRAFLHHNPSTEGPLVDLHGLYAREAVFYLGAHLQRCIARGEWVVECVVGVGNNSGGGSGGSGGRRLEAAVVALCRGLDVAVRRGRDSGVVVVAVREGFDASAEEFLLAECELDEDC